INNYFNQKQSLPFYWQDLFSINYRLKNIFDSIIGCTHINQFGPKLLKLFNIETEIIKNFNCFFEEYLNNIKYSREILTNNQLLFKQFKENYFSYISSERIDSSEKIVWFSEYFHNLKIISEQNEMINNNMNKILISSNI
ncbi:hypothetical protein KA977_11495, partial [Candidatus Dependentiae bacterium]|nr:hypothetical protein [Candidatus Dependentiae bacterium]